MPSAEAVLAAKPQVLVTPAGEATPDGHIADSLAPWRGFKRFEPIARQQTVQLPSDFVSRATPRVLLAADQLCVAMEGFRKAAARAP
jgi:ABC-type Fe3+-hydroxamate transport system substrate-binding protein